MQLDGFQFQLILPPHPQQLYLGHHTPPFYHRFKFGTKKSGKINMVVPQHEFTENMFRENILWQVLVLCLWDNNICTRIIFSTWYLGRGAAIACTNTLTSKIPKLSVAPLTKGLDFQKYLFSGEKLNQINIILWLSKHTHILTLGPPASFYWQWWYFQA